MECTLLKMISMFVQPLADDILDLVFYTTKTAILDYYLMCTASCNQISKKQWNNGCSREVSLPHLEDHNRNDLNECKDACQVIYQRGLHEQQACWTPSTQSRQLELIRGPGLEAGAVGRIQSRCPGLCLLLDGCSEGCVLENTFLHLRAVYYTKNCCSSVYMRLIALLSQVPLSSQFLLV